MNPPRHPPVKVQVKPAKTSLTINLGTLVLIRAILEVERGVTVSINEAQDIMTTAIGRLRSEGSAND